ncbi:hydrogenase iron-sulfur subunit [Oryzisolibacter sp. LB2S]|uniref:hydrogenase iron-sulfur subunit n=1 Tax=Alicycliphilus soli TaxID=3228789 RepID=UPI00345976E4
MPSPASTLPLGGLAPPEPAPAPLPLPRLARAYRRLEHGLDTALGARANPLKHLGALGFMLLWLLVASGSVLYIVLDTSAAGAYGSIDSLADVPWMLGTMLRGLHRYGADAFVLVMAVHILREWLLGRYRHWRRAIWWTGVPLVGLAFVSAIGGFWLNWDRLGQYSVVATAEWLDALPFLGAPLARNFLGDVSLSDRLFTLFIFIHIGMPLLMVFGLWFHIQRINLAKVFPPRPLAWAVLCMLLALSWALPVLSQGPADLRSQPTALALDWWLLFIHPVMDATSPAFAWGLVLLAFVLLVAPPLWPAPAREPVALVYPQHCSGCARCFDDCPYAAITMVAHTNGKPGMRLAEVNADLCASCGICAGACPSSTPFRSTEQLVTGIDMPQWPVHALRTRLVQGLQAMPGPQRLVVFGCAQGARMAVQASDVLHLPLACAGALPPAFIEYALRHGADGVLIHGCREGGCEFRLGQRWTAERLTGAREPHLRRSVPQGRWQVAWTDAGDERRLAAAVQALRQSCPAGAHPAYEESPP